jgi:hypothetical protein
MKTPTMQSNQWEQKDVTHDIRHQGGGVRREDGEFWLLDSHKEETSNEMEDFMIM